MISYSLEELAKHFEATQSNVHRYVTEADYNKMASKLERLITCVNYVLDGKADFTNLAEVCAMKPEQCLVERAVSGEIIKLKAERDEALAQIEHLRKANEAQKFCEVDLLDAAFQKAPGKCLAELKAEIAAAALDDAREEIIQRDIYHTCADFLEIKASQIRQQVKEA